MFYKTIKKLLIVMLLFVNFSSTFTFRQVKKKRKEKLN